MKVSFFGCGVEMSENQSSSFGNFPHISKHLLTALPNSAMVVWMTMVFTPMTLMMTLMLVTSKSPETPASLTP